MMLKDTRVTLRSYYDAFHRLQGTQYSQGDCKCCISKCSSYA